MMSERARVRRLEVVIEREDGGHLSQHAVWWSFVPSIYLFRKRNSLITYLHHIQVEFPPENLLSQKSRELCVEQCGPDCRRQSGMRSNLATHSFRHCVLPTQCSEGNPTPFLATVLPIHMPGVVVIIIMRIKRMGSGGERKGNGGLGQKWNKLPQ